MKLQQLWPEATFFIESNPGIKPVLLHWKFKSLTGKVTFWSIKKSLPVYLHKKHHIGSQLWVSLAGNSTRNTLLNFSIFVNLTYILKNPNYQPSTGVSYRVTSIINSARVCPTELPLVLSTQHECVLPSYQHYQLSMCVSYIIKSARVCPTELTVYYQLSMCVSYRVNSVLSTQHGCVILDLSPPASNTLIISPSLGQEISPSLGQEIGPSLGQEIGPSLGQETGPSLGQEIPLL